MRFVRDAVITLLIVFLVVVAVGYARVKSGGLSAEAQPSRLESSVARRLVRLSIPAEAKNRKNPVGEDAWREAADHFDDHCAVCHGSDGRGRTDIGANMYPKVPDLADPVVQQMTDGELFSIIQNGVRWTGMPGWKGEHSEDDTWKLVAFVRKVPSLTDADLKSAMAAHGNEKPDDHGGSAPDHKDEHHHQEPHR